MVVVLDVALDPANSNIVYVGTGKGLFKSVDGGMSWSSMNAGLTTTNVTTVAVDPVNSGTAYASMSDSIFRSTDGARNWTELVSFHGGYLMFFAANPRNGAILYAGFRPSDGTGRTQLLKSIDGASAGRQ